MDLARYSRQTVFRKIGPEGQQRLLAARVAVIGIGALGTVIANNLCRSGVGFLRLIDRDYVELSNLQRQILFDEQDAAEQTPKAVAACNHLSQVNSQIVLEPVVADVHAANIEALIRDVKLVLDGSDNAEVRHLLNEACHKLGIPWIYGGALASGGVSLNILPGDGPCYRCLAQRRRHPASHPTCSTAGVLNMATGIVAAVESAEAVKILLRSPDVRRTLFVTDVWHNTTEYLLIEKNPDCPVCGRGHYEFLGQLKGSHATTLCGRDAVQILPGSPVAVDFAWLAEKLGTAGTVRYNRFMLSFDDGTHSFHLFPDGRAIIKNVKSEASAKSVYAEYIG